MNVQSWLAALLAASGPVGGVVGYLGGRRQRDAGVAKTNADTDQTRAQTIATSVETAARANDVAREVVAMLGGQLADMERRMHRVEHHNDLLVWTLSEIRQRSADHEAWDRQVMAMLREAGIEVPDPPPLGDYLIPTDVDSGGVPGPESEV